MPMRETKSIARKRSRNEDHDDSERHSGTDDAHLTPKPYISPFSDYFRRRREIVPFDGSPSSEVENINELGHASPIGYNVATPIVVKVLHQTQGFEHENCRSDVTAKEVHSAITNFVKSVLSPPQNYTPEHLKDPIRVSGHKCASLRKATGYTIDDTSTDMSESATRPAPITAIIPVAEISQECYPDLPLAQFSNLACVLNDRDQLEQPKLTYDKILIEKSGDESNESNSNLNADISLNITEMVKLINNDDDDDECSSRMETSLETVEGYTVRKELAETLRLIILKHGDIASNCPLQNAKSRSIFLEQICVMVEQLLALDLAKVTLPQVESMLDFVTDLECLIDVKWLKKRLNDIKESKSLLLQSRSLKEDKMKIKQGIDEIQKGIEENIKMIAAIQEVLKKSAQKRAALEDESRIINEKCLEATSKVKRFYKRSLLHNIL